MSLCVCRNLPWSGSSVKPSTPEPRVSTNTVVALEEMMYSEQCLLDGYISTGDQRYSIAASTIFTHEKRQYPAATSEFPSCKKEASVMGPMGVL